MNLVAEKVNLYQILIFEILLILPVRSLLRFRCVCKEWCELIDSCLFKDRYLAFRRARSVDHDQVVGLKNKLIWIPSCQGRDDDSEDDDEVGLRSRFNGFILRYIYRIYATCWYGDYKTLARSASSSSNFFEISGIYTNPIRIISHVNGILCFYNGENWFDITLVNPALREIRKLPIPVFDLGGYKRLAQGTGFGYDDVNDVYKVVSIVTVFEQSGSESPYKHIAIVYRLNTNSWEILGDMSEFVSWPFVCITCDVSAFSHGSIHWCIQSDYSDDDVPCYWILAFNVTNELFREMPFPHGWSYFSIYNDYGMFPHLFTLDKSTIALVNSTNEICDVPKLEVWVMKEYGNNDSWTKQYSINNLPLFQRVISFWKKDKLLLLSGGLGLICYDLLKGQLNDDGDDDDNDAAAADDDDDDEPEEYSCYRIYEPVGIRIKGFDLVYGHLVTGHESFVSVKEV